ncbi:MAG: glycosyl hydrolase family 18 protein [Lachnospiraceae bacterium]
MILYTVQPGDSLDSIAVRYDISSGTIAYDNQIPYPYALTPGAGLLLSQTSMQLNPDDIFVTGSGRYAYSGGYAYPFINRWILEQTLPYLSDLFVFSYGFTTEGILIPPLWDDSFMISLAKEMGTAPILTLTPFGPDGLFNNALIHSIVNSPDATARLIGELTVQMETRGFAGVDIDFEYVLSEDRIPFAEFVRKVRNAMTPLGCITSVALAPKISDTQEGLLYGGKDYALLGDAADYVLLMTYEWGYTYGPPMAVAPLDKVRQVVEYALTRIPAEKINLGIPNYGYDWPLPYERGVTKARTLGNIEARQLAISQGVPIEFDGPGQSPHFTYTSDGILHEVWFEDVRSIHAKYGLIREYDLRGMSVWQIMQLFRGMWLLQADEFL